MTIAIYPGSFDPFTLGHQDVLRRALKLFDEVIVVVGYNLLKKGMFTPAERIDFINRVINADPVLKQQQARIKIEETPGLMARFASEVKADAIIRGVRSASEFEAETKMALLNRQLCGVETVLLISDPALSHISSSAVKEIGGYGGSIKGMIPEVIANDVKLAANGQSLAALMAAELEAEFEDSTEA